MASVVQPSHVAFLMTSLDKSFDSKQTPYKQTVVAGSMPSNSRLPERLQQGSTVDRHLKDTRS